MNTPAGIVPCETVREADMRPNWHAECDKFMARYPAQEVPLTRGAPEALDRICTAGDGNLHHDNQWGICECLSAAPAARKYGRSAACIGSGLNRHGYLLMQVRAELSTEMMLRAN
jgi:hypothetical protein